MSTFSDRELVELLADCDRSMKTFCQVFLPHVFTKPFSPLHDQLFSLLDDDSQQFVAVAAPRGLGKTSIFNMAFPLKRMLFKDSSYIIPVSATSDSAIEQAEELKTELLDNELIAELFGNLSPQERRDSFGQRAWVTETGIKVLPRGAGQQIRGRKHRSNRPDLIIVDDLEDDESVESEEQREKLERWFFSALLNSVDRGSKRFRVVVIGTILHEASLLNKLINPEINPLWKSVRLELFNDQYESAWPEHMSNEQIRTMVKQYKDMGLLDSLYREFRNIPTAKETQGFRAVDFQDYTESEEDLNANPDIETVILMDPARTMKSGSAMTAIAGVSVNTRTNVIYIRRILEDHMSPDQMIDWTLDMAKELNALVIAPEVTGLNEYVMMPLQNEISRRGLYYVLVEVKPREGKTGPRRSGGLIPFYRQHMVFHNPRTCGGLEKYLMQWPRPERWDVIDSVSGILFVMEEGERFFTPKEREETPDAIEAEYAELGQDEEALDYEMVV